MRAIQYLKGLYFVIFVVMLWGVYEASLQRNILEMGPIIGADKWFQATLWDTYFSFLAIALWICYRERHLWVGLIGFVLIMLGGNITIAVYMLIVLFTLKANTGTAGMRELLLGAKNQT